jgi:phosphoglycolate phosphatase
MIDSVVFDLDGTLWDTCSTCALGWNRVVARHKIQFRPITPEDVRRVAGKPHPQCIRETFVGLPEAQILTLVEETQAEDNELVSDLGGEIYAGVKEGLQLLATRYRLYIVSNCQSGYVESFLAWSGFGKLFKDFECWGNTGFSKQRISAT